MNASNPFSLAGRVALVTGSSRGLGRAMGVALGRAGAKVAFNYFNSRETAERAFADYKSRKLEGMLAQADVTDEDSVSRMTKQVAEQLGPIDIVVINATCDQPHKPHRRIRAARASRRPGRKCRRGLAVHKLRARRREPAEHRAAEDGRGSARKGWQSRQVRGGGGTARIQAADIRRHGRRGAGQDRIRARTDAELQPVGDRRSCDIRNVRRRRACIYTPPVIILVKGRDQSPGA